MNSIATNCKHSSKIPYSYYWRSQTKTVTPKKQELKYHTSLNPNISLTTYLLAIMHFKSCSKTVTIWLGDCIYQRKMKGKFRHAI